MNLRDWYFMLNWNWHRWRYERAVRALMAHEHICRELRGQTVTRISVVVETAIVPERVVAE